MFSKGGGRLQPHDAVVATKKHQTTYLCARPPNLLEQKLFGTPLPYYPSQRRKSCRSCKSYWKTRSRKSFWREQRRRWNKQDWSAVRLRQPKVQKKKKLDLAACEYTVAHCAEKIFQRPKNDPFPIPNGGGRLTINRKRGNACLGCVSSRRNRKKSRLGA